MVGYELPSPFPSNLLPVNSTCCTCKGTPFRSVDQYCRLRGNGVHCYLCILSPTYSLFKLHEFPGEKKIRKFLYIQGCL